MAARYKRRTTRRVRQSARRPARTYRRTGSRTYPRRARKTAATQTIRIVVQSEIGSVAHPMTGDLKVPTKPKTARF